MARSFKLSADPHARRLALTRIALGYSQQNEYAADAGIAPNTYNPYETGKRGRLPLDQANKLVQKYGLTLAWIYEGKPGGLALDLVMKLIDLGAMPPDSVPPGMRPNTQPRR